MVRVLVTGCFDIIHPGHIFLFQQAAALGDVVVIVARDSTIKKWKQFPPIIPEEQRLEVVRAIKYVKEAYLGNEENNYMERALNIGVDIIMLGPNQRIREELLSEELTRHHAGHIKIVRCEQFYDSYDLNSSTAIKQKICRIYPLPE